jgi:AbrB family looped-hinge helix DNA binding protein
MGKVEYYGSTVMSEKGQLVIPVEARERLGLKPGDKIMVMGDAIKGGLLLVNSDIVEALMHNLRKAMDPETVLKPVAKKSETKKKPKAAKKINIINFDN